ncbi:sulfotransferase 1B1-like [Dermacentor andersoni]|uniref:sulfotransferase 1B1-like n=1 Tax=Dermacentor andersoni TaxID=34620 RepID=UPI002155CE79|nr:sulfotransferase 1B1-like [Dermacentor andersoni]XP_054928691.1 sulfotransferase 1B1-like [Dermacentor andersoni]
MDDGSCRYVDGVWIHNLFQEEKVRSAMRYKPRRGDVILVTYPKCGTNWTQFIVWNILTKAESLASPAEFNLMCPFIELTGAEAAENPLRRGGITTHLPLAAFKPVEWAKYIYVTRNPYDCAVSYYHFSKGLTPKTFTDVSFEKFLSLFLTGKVIYGDYFDHLLPWYERRYDKNILLITYEQLKVDTRAEVLRIADFLGEEHGTALREDEALFHKIMSACSFENMKAFFTDKPMERVKNALETASIELEKPQLTNTFPAKGVELHEGPGYVRKGIVGDWKNYFTAEQIQQTKDWITKKSHGSDVMSLWKNCDLP